MNLMNNKVETANYPLENIKNKKHQDHNKPGFLVRATGVGYYGHVLRQAGDVFKISFARHFADASDPDLNGNGWMERVESPAVGKRGKSSAPQAEARGVKPPDEDPAERDARVAAFEKTAAADEENEADVI